MRSIRNFAITIVSGLLIALFGGSLAYAATTPPSSINGGSNSSDYQPPTRDPQSSGVYKLQQSTGVLQPIPGSNAVGQENLPTVGDLQVLGTKGQPITRLDTPPAKEPHPNLWPVAIVGVLTVAGIIYVVAQPDPYKRKKTLTKPAELPIEEPKKLDSKKKSSKKKKNRR